MKLNKTLMIAALIAGSVFAADVAVRAQDATNAPAPGARRHANFNARSRTAFNAISKRLALTDDQKMKAKPVFEEMMKKFADLRNDTSVKGAERRTKMKEIRAAATAKLKDILTPEQLAKWQKMGGHRRKAGAAKPQQ
jgi:Spy/CpxP family protein refolding chaperone